MTTPGDSQLFDDTFIITNYDQSKYDRVARITAVAMDNQTEMVLDINIELFPCQASEKLNVVLTTSLNADGSKDEDKGWKDIRNENSLADNYDYVCHGKIYKFEDEGDGSSIKAYISFGGMLMVIEGPYKKLQPLHVENTYLMIKK